MRKITIDGCKCIIGRIYGPHSYWVVREPISGVIVADPADTREKAIANARETIARNGGKAGFDAAVKLLT